MNIHLRCPQRVVLAAVVAFLILIGIAPKAGAQKAAIGEPIENASTIVLKPVADTYVTSAKPSTNHEGENRIGVGVNPQQESYAASLLRFSFSKLPQGTVIHSATLRLYQVDGSGKWSLHLDRISEVWDVATVTANSAPATSPYYTNLNSPLLPRPDYVEYDVTQLVRAWIYNIPNSHINYGLRISGPSTEEAVSRVFSSSETGDDSPELVLNYTAPPSNLVIPYTKAIVKVDGVCDPSEYADALRIPYIDYNGKTSYFYLQHKRYNTFVCIEGVPGSFSERHFGVYLDKDYGQEKYSTADDFFLRKKIQHGQMDTFSGPVVMDSQFEYLPAKLGPWTAGVHRGEVVESAEYLIPLRLEAENCGASFGLALSHQWITDNGVDYSWPIRRVERHPADWVRTRLEQPRCIRVCADSAVPCGLAEGALVLNGDTGAAYDYDEDGYLTNALDIDYGTTLWAHILELQEDQYSLFSTSGPPQVVEHAAFQGGEPGTMSLIVADTTPLMVHDLDFSAQWYVDGDAAYAAQIEADILKASDFLYDITDGQLALGRVRIYQNFERWDVADVKLYANNNYHAEADSGGIVEAPTLDPDFGAVTYYPGEARMGATWNRFNLPGTPEGLPVDTSDDWSLVLAHEVGHYLLYLDDTYYRLRPDGTIENVFTCDGSAMGWIYEKHINTEFVFDQAHWDANCKDTSGNLLRVFPNGSGRTEWATIQEFYPWFAPPTGASADSGPKADPAGVTRVRFIDPSPITPTLPDQVFDLQYRAGKTASDEARALLYRDDRVIDQGRPLPGMTTIELHGAQVGDRFCVYDLNAHAVAPETQRHQYGCETLKAGDAILRMERDTSWEPMLLLTPISGNEVHISVQPVQPGVLLRARLYPEDHAGSTTVDLAVVGDEYVGVFNLPAFTPSAYVQVFVREPQSETDPRRETVVDYGAGGGGLPGPAHSGHAPIVTSSDGEAIFVGQPGNDPAEEEYVAWQSMAGTPDIPAGFNAIGKAYQLLAVPSSLVDDGSVSLRYGSPVGQPGGAAEPTMIEVQANMNPVVHYWNSSSWIALNTSVVQEPNGTRLASAPSNGAGIYTLLLDDASSKLDQTIGFPSIPRQTIQIGSYQLHASASSGLPVLFTSRTPSTCSITGDIAHLLLAGTCTIEASQPGDITYNSAPIVVRSFEIEGSGGLFLPSIVVE